MEWKDPTLLFDLEGVLIASIYAPVLHHEAHAVLGRACRDGGFRQIGLWTLVDWPRAGSVLAQKGLVKYFDFVIATVDSSTGMDNVLVWRESGENEVLTRSPYNKDLYVLPGFVEDKVLIDDDPRNGFPKEMVVMCESFDGEQNHSLVRAYEAALKLVRKG